MELLKRIHDRGYPTDYLLSRIKGRRVRLIVDWQPLIFGSAPFEHPGSTPYSASADMLSSEGMWRHLLTEYRWVYAQMNEGLRNLFMPFFFYAELKTLFLALRFKAANESAGVEKVLTLSLLSEELKKILTQDEPILSTIERIEAPFAALSAGFRGIGKVFSKDGIKSLEQVIASAYLEYVMASRLHPLIRNFFSRIVDARNIITLYKQLRWDLKSPVRFIGSGSIGNDELRGVLDKGDIFQVSALVKKATGRAMAKTEVAAVEQALYTGITEYLHRARREPTGIGVILDYLWRCSIEARNLAIIFHGKDLDRDVVKAELVQ